MCNRLHDDSIEIPESGTGWKLFTLKNNKLYPLVHDYWPYIKRNIFQKWIEFQGNGGFCFFLNKPKDEIADEFYVGYPIVCLEIEYKNGLGRHIEIKFITNVQIEIALCKFFKLVNNEENRKYHF